MRFLIILLTLSLLPVVSFGQAEDPREIKLERADHNLDSDLRDLLNFKGVEFKKIEFRGDELNGKTYKIEATEIWNGEVKEKHTIIDTSELPVSQLQRISGDSFQIRILSELTAEDSLKIMFRFPGFSTVSKFDALDRDDYSLRYAHLQQMSAITPGESFFLLNYILPYEENGIKHYCSVDQSGSDVYRWGEEFGIEHYLVITMTFND